MKVPPFAAIITAAGKSERFDAREVKKEYLQVDGKSVLERATAPFISLASFIVVTYPKGKKDQCAVALGELFTHQRIPTLLCEGGESRQASVLKALEMVHTLPIPVQFVAIHDGARCYVTENLIINTLATASIHGGSAPVVRTCDAIKSVDRKGMVTAHLPRVSTFGMQTPQIFRYPEILEAHREAAETDKQYIDDTEIFTDAGYEVAATPGDRKNIKITFKEQIPDADRQIDNYLKSYEKGMEQRRNSEDFRKELYKV